MKTIKILSKSFLIVFISLIPLFLIAQQTDAQTANSKQYAIVKEVIDGDTLRIIINGKTEKLRLIGIDAPEIHKNRKAYIMARKSHKSVEYIIKMGELSKRYVCRILKPGDKIIVEFDVQLRDKYGRLLGYVFLPSGEMLNEKILKDGYASILTIPPDVKYVSRLYKAYVYARKNNKGLWSKVANF